MAKGSKQKIPAELQGRLLVASPRLGDPNFARTVVLMIRHDEEGSLGLILNRPLELSIQEACERVLEIPCRVEGPLHHGGPCEGPLMLLHADDTSAQLEGDQQVIPGVYFAPEKDRVEQLLSAAPAAVKCYAGYAGWSAGQLAGEMEEGAWFILPATSDLVFGNGAEGRLWPKLMTGLTLGGEIDPKLIPDDPSVN
jgi:putative transcriptional regulator